jgi:hypothetical protein
MTRAQLEHILRAAGAITNEDEIVILGSQAVLGTVADAPEELSRSVEADAFPPNAPDKTDLIDGTLGELSPFHETHGYYAHGITPESTVLADGWRERLVRVQSPATHGVVGLCLSVPDLAVSKLAASREKDIDFVVALVRHRLLAANDVKTLADRLTAPERSVVLRNLDLCQARA